MSTPTRLSSRDYEAFIALPENRDRRFELIHGEIVEKMPTGLHAFLVGLLIQALMNYLEQHPIAYAGPEPRFQPTSESAHNLIPDAAVWSLNYRLTDEKVMVGVPDLAIEVQSPGQSEQFMSEKARIYLTHGSAMVWLVYPKLRIVEVLTPTNRHLLGVNDVLSGGEVLPGFELAISKIFDRLT